MGKWQGGRGGKGQKRERGGGGKGKKGMEAKGKETELERAEGGREGGRCKQGTTNEGGLDPSHTY